MKKVEKWMENQWLVLDGGLATELERMGFSLNNELWSAAMIEKEPDAIKEIHFKYFESGANAAVASSYQATISGFINIGYSREKAYYLLEKSMELAIEARDEWWNQSDKQGIYPLAIASIGPYGAYLADGSEYTGDYKVSEKELYGFHWEKIEILKNAGAEMFAIETFPRLDESVICATILEEMEMEYYISFSFQTENKTNGGQTIAECVKALRSMKYLKALGANCTSPLLITNIIKEYKKESDLPVIVYPNSGELYNEEKKQWEKYADFDFKKLTAEWIEAGAKIIGGCCRTTPKDIKDISEVIKSITFINRQNKI